MKQTTIDDLRMMNGSEGFILQGCDGDLNEWVDAINGILTENGILLDGTNFQAESILFFDLDGHTNLLFPLDKNVHLNLRKLKIWSHNVFSGTWLSDYVNNKLGGFLDKQETNKPDCPLIGADGNIFALVGIASQTLRRDGMADQATEMCDRVTASGSYTEALAIIGEYVNITSIEDQNEQQECRYDL